MSLFSSPFDKFKKLFGISNSKQKQGKKSKNRPVSFAAVSSQSPTVVDYGISKSMIDIPHSSVPESQKGKRNEIPLLQNLKEACESEIKVNEEIERNISLFGASKNESKVVVDELTIPELMTFSKDASVENPSGNSLSREPEQDHLFKREKTDKKATVSRRFRKSFFSMLYFFENVSEDESSNDGIYTIYPQRKSSDAFIYNQSSTVQRNALEEVNICLLDVFRNMTLPSQGLYHFQLKLKMITKNPKGSSYLKTCWKETVLSQGLQTIAVGVASPINDDFMTALAIAWKKVYCNIIPLLTILLDPVKKIHVKEDLLSKFRKDILPYVHFNHKNFHLSQENRTILTQMVLILAKERKCCILCMKHNDEQETDLSMIQNTNDFFTSFLLFILSPYFENEENQKEAKMETILSLHFQHKKKTFSQNEIL